MGLLLSLIPLAIIVFALVDLVRTPDGEVKHLPKIGWIVIIVLLPLIGSLVWLIAGKDRANPIEAGSLNGMSFGDPRRHEVAGAASSARPLSTEEELAAIDREIAFHENEARIRRLESELQRKREQS